MNLKKICFQPQNRRGLSSVVGALFFTVLMISGFSVLGLALDAQEDIVTTQRVISDIEIKKQQEEFGVLASVDGNDLLSIHIQNQGQNPVEISSMWIINKTLSDQPVKRYTINYNDAFVSSGFTNNVLSSQTLEMIPDVYGIKVITALGSIKTVELDADSGTSVRLRAELITDPPDVIMGQNVTVAMLVTNTGDITISNVRPELQPPTGSGSVDEISLNAPSMVRLIPGESVLFSWDTRVDGLSGQDVVFSAKAWGEIKNPDDVWTDIVSDTSIIRDPADSGETTIEVIVLTQDLLSRPEIFMIIPSPMGDGTAVADKALWGANIVNPTAHPMFVNKVVISLLSPRANNNDIMFSASTGTHKCNAETVSPTPDKWSCPESNQLMWEDLTNPIEIQPYSVFPFLALVHPDRLASGGDELSAVIVHGNVFTTVGQFGKAGYGTSFDNGATSIASVFLSKDVNSINKNDILSNQTGIASGSLITFNVTLADFEAGGLHWIDDTSRLIINIPKGWIVDEVLYPIISDDFTTSYQYFDDTSSQIIGVLDNNLFSGGATIQFKASAPTVGNPQMYVMYLLADGSTDNGDFTIGPLQEAILQVIPPPLPPP